MPLFDHFHPPLYPHHHWESFHSNWATRIADGIAALLPMEFQVEEHIHAGVGFEIDVAAAFQGPNSRLLASIPARPVACGAGGPDMLHRLQIVRSPLFSLTHSKCGSSIRRPA